MGKLEEGRLKLGWKIVKFGDVVRNANLVERDPIGNGIEQIVAIEHIEPENLHICSWNNPEDGTSFSRKFVSGQTLFVKRRAYQRKVAYAEFEGICSGDILTFEPKDSMVLLPELLPFICQTNTFFDHVLDTSAGSLSPRTSWKAIKDFEFPLPPLEEQKRIAEILWAADETHKQFSICLKKAIEAKKRLLIKLTTKGLSSEATQKTCLGKIAVRWEVKTIEEITIICQYGLSMPLHESGKYPILRMMNYDDGKIITNDLKYVNLSDADFTCFRMERGDILFNRTNSADLVGKVGIFQLDGDYVFASYLVRLRADKKIMLSDFLNYYLNSDLGQRKLLVYATPGVSQANISAGNMKKVFVPVPPIKEQQKIVAILQEIDKNKDTIKKHLDKSRNLLFTMINDLIVKENNREVAHV